MNYTRTTRDYKYQLIIKKTRRYLYLLLILTLLVVLWCQPYRSILSQYMVVITSNWMTVVVNQLDGNFCNIIKWTMPAVNSNPNSKMILDSEVVLLALGSMSGVEMQKPESIFQSQMPLLLEITPLPVIKKLPVTVPPVTILEPVEKKPVTTSASDSALVAIYNTHSGETYALTDGVARLDGQRGGVVRVAMELEKHLEQQDIRVVRSNAIHDAQYNLSYLKSEKTVQNLLTQNKDLKILLDIHRDAGVPRSGTVITINDQELARILIIVGSDARRLFPNWQQNLILARKIDQKINQRYPGLSRGVRVKEGRYNQQHHSGILLFEIGAVKNTQAEAERSVKILGDILVDILKAKDYPTEMNREI